MYIAIKDICLFIQYSQFRNGYKLFATDLAQRNEFQVTGIVFLSEMYKLWNRIMHDVTEFSAACAFLPVFTVSTYIELISIDCSRFVFTFNRSIGKSFDSGCFSQVNHQWREIFALPEGTCIVINCC